jgi:hypothetical protein
MKNISARNKGIITAVVMIALTLFFYYGLKQPVESPYQYGVYAAYTIGILWTLISFNKTVNKGAKFKDYFQEGFKTFAIVTLFMVAFVFIFFSANPEIRDAKFAENNRLLLQEGNHTAAEIEANTKQMKRIFIPMMLGITTFVYLFLGVLVTVVTAGFLSQKKTA